MSKKIGLFYGTQTGNTATIAQAIRNQLGADQVDLNDIADTDLDAMMGYDYLIIGGPTWNIGELQLDWDTVYADLDNLDFNGKTVAYFGCGDQVGYADNFMDAVGILEAKITERGGQTVGFCSTDGYEFDGSLAVRDGKFVGLAIDEDNQPELTDERLVTWVNQIRVAMAI